MHNIIGKETAQHYIWGNQCDAWVLTDSQALSVKVEKMPPGTKEQLHFHQKARQVFYILNGTATFYLTKEYYVINAHQGMLIEPNTPHFISNESEENLEFMVVSQPSADNDRIVVGINT